MGVASKEHITPIASNADRRGLRVHGRIMFKVMSHCSVILHQFSIQTEWGAPALTAVKWFFHVQQHRFTNVDAVDVRWCVLNLGLLLHYEVIYVLGSFIVHLVQLWLISSHS